MNGNQGKDSLGTGELWNRIDRLSKDLTDLETSVEIHRSIIVFMAVLILLIVLFK
jgi:hypothetical protein